MEERISTDEVLRRYRAGVREFCDLDIDDVPSGAAPLKGAILEGADFSRSFIVADFSGACLRGAIFRSANVKTCVFDRADLSDADFRDAGLDGATFVGVLLNGANFEGASEQSHRYARGEIPSDAPRRH